MRQLIGLNQRAHGGYLHKVVDNISIENQLIERFVKSYHIPTGSWKGRGNQYIEFARVVYCKLPTNGKQLPAFPHKALTGIEPRPQRWEARVLPLCHRGPLYVVLKML